MSTSRTTRRVRKPGSGKSPSPASSRSGLGSKLNKNKTTDVNTDDIDQLVPKGLSAAFVKSKLHEKKLREAGLSEPTDPFDGDMPDLPSDIGQTDHEELSQLMMDMQRAYSTAQWRASKAYIESDIFEEIGDYLENKALLGSKESNDGKRRADAKTDDTVVAFRGRQKEAYHDYVRFRDLGRTIEGKVKVLSRVGGFKGDDDEASDRTAKPRMSRGKAKGSGRRSRSRTDDD